VEIPQYRLRRDEELQRKARFLALPRQKCAQIENKSLKSSLIANFFPSSFLLFPSPRGGSLLIVHC
jgi:hypothetical protein